MAVIKQRATQLYGCITIRPRDDTETMSYDLVTSRRYAISTWGVEGETSCHQGGTQELKKVYIHLLTLVFNEDDIRRYLFDLGTPIMTPKIAMDTNDNNYKSRHN